MKNINNLKIKIERKRNTMNNNMTMINIKTIKIIKNQITIIALLTHIELIITINNHTKLHIKMITTIKNLTKHHIKMISATIIKINLKIMRFIKLYKKVHTANKTLSISYLKEKEDYKEVGIFT